MEAVKTKQGRIFYLDVLRVLAAFGVIMVHVSSQNWEVVDIRSWEKQVFYAYNIGVSWAVPLFVMLSGAIFLDNDRPLDIRKLYTKNIFRLVMAFVFWSGIYALADLLAGYNLWHVKDVFLEGHVHMWYIYLAIGYYMATPVLRQVTASKKATEYFLILTTVMLILLPSAISFLKYRNLPMTGLLTQVLDRWHSGVSFGFTGIYLVYYVLGFYLHKYSLPGWFRKLMPLLAIAGYGIQVYMTLGYVQRTGSGEIPVDFAALYLPMTVGLFLLGKGTLSRAAGVSGKLSKGIRAVSDQSFGIYMVHMLVMYKLKDWLGVSTLAFDPRLSIPAITLLVMAVSFCISWMLHKIPVLKKYVV